MSYDLAILHGQMTGQMTYAVGAQAIDGTPKVIGKFAWLFSSARDLVRNRGTEFSTLLAKGLLRTNSDIIIAFTTAVQTVLDQLGDQRGLPASEQLVGADLLSQAIEGDKVHLVIQLRTLDGVTTFPLAVNRL